MVTAIQVPWTSPLVRPVPATNHVLLTRRVPVTGHVLLTCRVSATGHVLLMCRMSATRHVLLTRRGLLTRRRVKATCHVTVVIDRFSAFTWVLLLVTYVSSNVSTPTSIILIVLQMCFDD